MNNYVHVIVKDSKNNMEKYLFTENERLNAIIDELQQRIDKAIDFIKHNAIYSEFPMLPSDTIELLEILGDKENE